MGLINKAPPDRPAALAKGSDELITAVNPDVLLKPEMPKKMKRKRRSSKETAPKKIAARAPVERPIFCKTLVVTLSC